MLNFRKPPRREFHYTPLFLKESKPELRERLRIPRSPDYFSKRRSSLQWIFLLVLFLGLFEYLFPGVVRRWFRPGVEIGMHDSLERLAQDVKSERTYEGKPQPAPDSTASGTVDQQDRGRRGH